MIYTDKIKSEVRRIGAPSDFVMDIVEYHFNPPFIALRFYEKQWVRFSDVERMRCVNYLNAVKRVIESNGVLVTLEPVSDVLDI